MGRDSRDAGVLVLGATAGEGLLDAPCCQLNPVSGDPPGCGFGSRHLAFPLRRQVGGGEWALGTGPGAHGHPHGSLLYPPEPEFAESKPAVKLEHVRPKGQDGWARG